MHSNAGRISAKLLGVMAASLVALVLIGMALMRRAGGIQSHGDLIVWLSGDTRGYLEPCGCRSDQAGGLPARMTLLTQDHAPNRLLVDVGNMTSGGRSYELLKFDYVLRGMQAMGYDAVNLGKREVNLDRNTLLDKIRHASLPFVSCNVIDHQTGRPLVRTSLIKEIGGKKIGITGVVQADPEAVGPGLRVRPPQEALAEILPGLKAGSDFVIVLAYAPPETLHDIASKFHEIDAVLGGDVPQSSEQAERVNRAVLFSVTEKGKVIGRLDFRPDAENGLTLAEARAYKTADTITPAPAMVALIKEYKGVLRDRNFQLATEEGMDPINAQNSTADLYVGQEKCVGCHADAHRIAQGTAHVRAYDTLQKKGSEYDPECLRCHTVGYGAKDGFINLQATPALAGVQCESCHGRGAEHIKAVQAGKQGREATDTLRAVTPNSCVRCHDPENSANFVYATFWERIKHGKNGSSLTNNN